MNRKEMQPLLDQGIFREIDIHFARFITRLSGDDDPALFFAAALLSRAAGEGDVCFDLSEAERITLVTDGRKRDVFVPPDLQTWLKILRSSSVVGNPGDFTPLILDDRYRLYLYKYRQYEEWVADGIRARAGWKTDEINWSIFKERLSRLFPDSGKNNTDRQKAAVFVSVLKPLCVISGGPGTGKSTIISMILSMFFKQNMEKELSVALTAPTGKAASRMREAISNGMKLLPSECRIEEDALPRASTIHRLLGAIPGSPFFRYNAENLLPCQLVIVDEASMVDMALMARLIKAVPQDAGLILIGDRDQLASVEAGAVLADICDTGHVHGFSMDFKRKYLEITGNRIDTTDEMENQPGIQDCVVQLKKSYRFGTESGIGEVSRAVNNGDGELALGIIKRKKYKEIQWKPIPAPNLLSRTLKEYIIHGYKGYLKAEDPIEAFHLFERFRILCALRNGPYGVSALNLIVEKVLKDEKLISPGKVWYRGRPVLITKNDYNLRLFNGDIGIILPDPDFGNELRAFFLSGEEKLRKFSPMRLSEYQTAYAMTVHKSQGSEFEKIIFILPDRDTPVMTRELIYTGITRAKNGVEVWGKEELFLKGVSRRTKRASGLHDMLWRRDA